MSIARRPRRIGASALSLALVAGLLLVGPAATGSPAGQGPDTQVDAVAPWWVEWLGVFDLDRDRIDDEAEKIAQRALQNGNADKTVPVLVTFATGLPADRSGFLDYLGVTKAPYFFKTQPVVDLDVPAAKLHRLSGVPGVAAVEHDRVLRPHLNVSSPATQANNGVAPNDFYNGRTADDLGYTGKDMVVAVLDTGIKDEHAAFAGKRIAGAYVALPQRIDCVNTPDDDSHGTHVAATAIGNQSAGNLYGTAKDAKLVEVKISLGIGSIGGSARGFEFVKLYNDAIAAGRPMCGPNDDRIDVATLSFGSSGRGGPNAGTEENFINALVSSGVAVTIAVGNCGPSPSATCTFGDTDNGISSPGNAAGAIGVANYNDGGTVDRANDVISPSSSRGPNNQSGDTAAGGATGAATLLDRYRKPDVAAPGTSIVAAQGSPTSTSTTATTSKSGTSMATPHVAGIAALLLQAGEEAKMQTGGRNLMASTGNGFVNNSYALGVYPVRDAIIHSTDYKSAGAEAKWTGPNSRGVEWNNSWGYGQVNAFGALCWAWEHVLAPGGATPPAAVSDNCGQVDPDPTSTPTPTPTPTATATPTPSPSPTGPLTDVATYYFHSEGTRFNAADKVLDANTFDATKPPWTDPALALDLPFQGGNSGSIYDPTWVGAIEQPLNSLTVDFWHKGPEEEIQTGKVEYAVAIWSGTTRIAMPFLPVNAPAPGAINRVVHTFTADATGAPLNVPAGEIAVEVGLRYINGAGPILFDAAAYPSGFSYGSIGGGGGGGGGEDPDPDPLPPGPRGVYPSDPDDPLFADQWGMTKIQAPQAWQEQNATGHGINIAIVDSGVDLGHEDFYCPGKIAILPGSDISVDDRPQDEDGHGTHVAGIAAACTNNGKGVVGVAPDATLIPVRVLGESDLDKAMADGIRFATDNGAHVINLSIGDIPPFSHLGPDGYPKTEEAMQYARSNGVVIAAAAGNFVQPTCEYPSLSRNVICVVATDRNDLRSWYTDLPVNIDRNSDDPKMEPVVAAPGGQGTFCEEGIVSTFLRSEASTCYETGYDSLDGTSMSSPHVAGLAALLYDRIGGERSKANADRIVQTILDTSDDLYSPGWDPIVGHGRINALRAVRAIETAPEPVVTNVAFASQTIEGQHSDDVTIGATLTEASGAPLAGKTLVFTTASSTETLSWTAETDADGLAAVNKRLDLPPGRYQLMVQFGGEADTYEPSSDLGGLLVVSKESTTTVLEVAAPTGKGRKSSRTLTATVSDPDGSSFVAGRTVTFYSDGELMGTAETNAKGVAEYKTPHNFAYGHRFYEAQFAGDDFYIGSWMSTPS